MRSNAPIESPLNQNSKYRILMFYVFQTVEDKLTAAAAGDGIELDLSKLNKKEKVQLFHRESPEFKGIMADFRERVEEASSRLQPVLDLVNDGLLPPNNQAATYVRTKHQLILKYGGHLQTKSLNKIVGKMEGYSGYFRFIIDAGYIQNLGRKFAH